MLGQVISISDSYNYNFNKYNYHLDGYNLDEPSVNFALIIILVVIAIAFSITTLFVAFNIFPTKPEIHDPKKTGRGGPQPP